MCFSRSVELHEKVIG
ncbi:TPA: hypothetical protein ACV5PQ_005392, partial [Escherichia coli]